MTLNTSEPQRKLLELVKFLLQRKQIRQKLEQLKSRRYDLKKSDFIWNALLLSLGSWGRAAAGERLMKNPTKISFASLNKLSRKERGHRLVKALKDAEVRMVPKKARFLNSNFDIIAKHGPAEVKRQLLSQSGREAKMKFLRKFKGIGPKYARNMMMDIYHEDFRESIAVDERIKNISNALGLQFKGREYREEEEFYLRVAHKAGLNGWELDRLMFNFNNTILELLQ